jgi:hypothetical protein
MSLRFPFSGLLLLLVSTATACGPAPQEPAAEPRPAPSSDHRSDASCQQLYDRVVVAYRRLGDIRAKSAPEASATYLAIGDVMDRLDATLGEMRPERDDVRLLVGEYRTAARSMAVASREAGQLLAKAEEATAKMSAENGPPRALTRTVDRMVAHCKRTRDETCKRVADPLRALGEGTPSAERIETARSELGAIKSSDPELRGSIDALRETLAEMASLMRVAGDLEKRGRARSDDYARAAHGFSGLQHQATAACGREIRASENL